MAESLDRWSWISLAFSDRLGESLSMISKLSLERIAISITDETQGSNDRRAGNKNNSNDNYKNSNNSLHWEEE